MKRFLALLLIFVFVFAAAGCGTNGKNEETGKVIDTDKGTDTEKVVPFELPDLRAAVDHMVIGLGMTDMTELDAESLTLRYCIVDKYTEVCAIVSASIASDECVIFKANDATAAAEIVELLETYRDDRIELYNGYAPEETPKLKSAYIGEKNGYVVFAATLDPETAELLFFGLPKALEG